MRKNYISAVLLICFALKLQAQTPSINEAQRVSYFSDSYTKKIDDKVETLKAKNDALDAEAKNEKDINKIAAITAEKQVNTDLINALQIYGNVDAKKDYSELFNKLINQKRDTINNVYAQGLKSDKLTLGQIDSIYNPIAKKRKEIAALEIERDETVAAFGKFPWFFPSWKKLTVKSFFTICTAIRLIKPYC